MRRGLSRAALACVVLVVGLALGVAVRSALLAVGRFVFVALLCAVGVAALLLVTATPAYNRATVGRAARVVERSLDEPSTCVDCDERIDAGRRHRFVREWVLFGVPLVLVESGQNDYCAECVDPGELPESQGG